MHADLILVRHAESVDDRDDIVAGSSDYSLTAEGRQQAELLAERLDRDFSIDALYCCDTARTIETADRVARATGVAPRAEEGLAPHDIGFEPGLTQAEAAAKYPHIWSRPVGVHECLPGGEPYALFHERVTTTLTRLLDRHPEETICVITHGLIISAYYRHFSGYAMEDRHKISVMTNLASIHHFSFRPESTFRKAKRRVLRINDTAHLLGSAPARGRAGELAASSGR